MNTNETEKKLLTLSVLVKRADGADPELHEVTLLAKDENEVQERLKRWLAVTRKGRSVISWEKKIRCRRQKAD